MSDGETVRELRVKSTELSVALSVRLRGDVEVVGFYDESRTRTALAAERWAVERA